MMPPVPRTPAGPGRSAQINRIVTNTMPTRTLMHWDGTPETEKRIKDEFGVISRNRPFDLKQEPGKCILTGNPSPGRIVFAKAY